MQFSETYERHLRDVYGFLAYRARSSAEAEDLTQETFERALRAWDRFDPAIGTERAWLLTIARNVYIDSRRRAPARREIPAADPGESGDSEPGPEDRLGADPAVLAAIGQLGRREREAIALRFGGDLRAAEIGELLGVSTPSVQQTLSRALRRLRGILEAPPEADALRRSPPPPSPRSEAP